MFHDAYQYFEKRFGLQVVGALSLGDATDPGPARVAQIRDAIVDNKVNCVFSEPQYRPGLVQVVVEGTNASVAILDPLGSDLEPGKSHYTQTLGNLAKAVAECG